MEYFLGEYIEDSVQREVLNTATNKAEYCQYRAAIIRNNCLTKFRGWDKGQIGEKSRERVLDSIINGKIFFAQIAITSWTRRGKNLGHGWSRRIYP